MHFLVYVSAASHLMSEDELVSILETSRTHNIAADITGLLLYKDGSFMQFLEGSRESILQTYQRIEQDTRHNGLIILRQGEHSDRSFPNWSMGFRSVNSAELQGMPGFAGLSGNTFISPEITTKPHIALRLLKTFHTTTS